MGAIALNVKKPIFSQKKMNFKPRKGKGTKHKVTMIQK